MGGDSPASLKNGDQGAVAATFEVHAFTVDAARRHLASADSELAASRPR